MVRHEPRTKTRNPHLPNLSSPEAVRVSAASSKNTCEGIRAPTLWLRSRRWFARDFSPETVKRNTGFVAQGGRQGVDSEASITEEWMGFVNAVAAEVHKEFPEVYIASNGYANGHSAQGVASITDRGHVAASGGCTLHAYDDPHCWQKVRQGQMLRRWAELCDVWVYGYNYNLLVSALTPFPKHGGCAGFSLDGSSGRDGIQ